MIKLIIEINEEMNMTFMNKDTMLSKLNIDLIEKGIKATKGEMKALEYIKDKLEVDKKVQYSVYK